MEGVRCRYRGKERDSARPERRQPHAAPPVDHEEHGKTADIKSQWVCVLCVFPRLFPAISRLENKAMQSHHPAAAFFSEEGSEAVRTEEARRCDHAI
jgi:hypothetical protein